MKGSFFRLRGKEMSLILVVLVCTTIFIWAWDRTPFLTTFLPPKSQSLFLSPENKPVKYQEGQLLNIVAPTGPVAVTLTTPAERKEIPPNVAKDEAKHKQILEAEKGSGGENSTILMEVKEIGKLTLGDKNSKQEKQIVNVIASTDSGNISSSERVKGDKKLTVLEENQACSYAKGKWVVDDGRPLYNGSDCKKWLSQMWACRLMKRADFAYENLRWQPKDCQMEDFEGSKFLTRYYYNCVRQHFSNCWSDCLHMVMAYVSLESYLTFIKGK